MNLTRHISWKSINKRCRSALLLLALAWTLSLVQKSTGKQAFMDPADRNAFLASVEAEEEWLDSVSRRLSVGGTPIPSESSQPSYPNTSGTPKDTRQPAGGPVRRSGRKRKPTSEALDARKTRMASSSNDSVLDQLKDMMKEMKEVREDVNKSSTNMTGRIDSLSKKMTDRMSKTEQSVKCLSQDMAFVKADLSRVRREASNEAARVERMVGDIVDKKLNSNKQDLRRPRYLTGANASPVQAPSTDREDAYLDARKTLRMWPVEGEDLPKAALQFMRDKLLLADGRVRAEDISVQRLNIQAPNAPTGQVMVKFPSVRMRDEVRNLARNLRGEQREVGIQMEVPDHLRGRYQTFQTLAYQLKQKYPGLKRNIKFVDTDMSLAMDVKLDADTDWKTVLYEDAKAIVPSMRPRTASFTRAELTGMVSKKNSEKTQTDKPDTDSDMDDDTFVDVSDSDENTNDKNYSVAKLSFINTNARSLGPKVESLFDCIHEKAVDIAFVTETWYQSNRDTNEDLDQYAARFSLGVIHRNRDGVAANGRQYGGVAMFYRLATSSFKEFDLINPEGHELLATVGTVKGVKGKIFCLTAYAPPNLTLLKARQFHDYISDVLDEAKRKYADCSLILAGDFNHWPVEEAVEEHVEITEIKHGNTRGNRAIDRTFTNFHRSITEYGCLPPLETEDGRPSDHKIAFALAEFLKPKTPTTTYTYRHFTPSGATQFASLLAEQSWTTVFSAVGPSAKVATFQAILETIMSVCFLTKTTTRRVSDPPWVNNKIRKLSRRRRKVYDKEGRSPRWKAMKKQCRDLYNKRAAVYMEEQKKVLTAADASRSFYKNVRAYQSKEKPPQFDVRDLYPGTEDEVIADNLANYFNAISSEFDGLTEEQVPITEPRYLPFLSISDVAARLLKFRKPKSKVAGDIFPSLVNQNAPLLAIPQAHIFNSINISHVWPEIWKIEYVTPIPKKSVPESPNDLRNISCTQLFSKIYESFILEWLTSQVSLRNNQYGGVKGRGAEHLLVNLWQRVLENIEDSRAASLLTSIDYAKAFNRLDFSHCLKCLHAKGANGKLIKIVASFLTGRQMRVKVGSALSPPRPVLGGVPQGSLLGVFLFDLAIDDFEAFSGDVEDYSPVGHQLTVPAPGGPQDCIVPPEPTHRDHRHASPFMRELLQVLKFVDDNVFNEKLNFDTVRTDGHCFRTKQAFRTQNLTNRVIHQAESVGMKVHHGKTQSLLISEVKSYNPSAFFIDANGNRIESGHSMKILGVHFSSDPDMKAQVESIKRSFRNRKWILHHLGHRSFSKQDLLAVYKSTILPVHDYCSCVFNSSLTLSQASALERLQGTQGYLWVRALLLGPAQTHWAGFPTGPARLQV